MPGQGLPGKCSTCRQGFETLNIQVSSWGALVWCKGRAKQRETTGSKTLGQGQSPGAACNGSSTALRHSIPCLPQTGNGLSAAKQSNYFAQTLGPQGGEPGSAATWLQAEEADLSRCCNAAKHPQMQLGEVLKEALP